jgi:hypothetical protein
MKVRIVDPEKAKAKFLAKLRKAPRAKRKPTQMMPFAARREIDSESCIYVQLPIRAVNEKNNRDHFRSKARRTDRQRSVTRNVLEVFRWIIGGGQRYVVKLTRAGPRRLDGDNNIRSLSAVRDGVADFLRINDGSDSIEWKYDQHICLCYGVEIRIERAE